MICFDFLVMQGMGKKRENLVYELFPMFAFLHLLFPLLLYPEAHFFLISSIILLSLLFLIILLVLHHGHQYILSPSSLPLYLHCFTFIDTLFMTLTFLSLLPSPIFASFFSLHSFHSLYLAFLIHSPLSLSTSLYYTFLLRSLTFISLHPHPFLNPQQQRDALP